MSLASISTGSYLLFYGNFNLAEKTTLAGKVRVECGKVLWQTLMKTNPNVITGHDIGVIFNSTTSLLTFQFDTPAADNYTMTLRCVSPSTNGGTGYTQLNNGEKTIWSTAPSYIPSQQNVVLYTDVALGSGLQTVMISFKDPMAIIGLTIQNADMTFDMYISAITTFLYPNKKYIVSRTLVPDYIVPAINTKLYGPPLTTGPPYTGTPGPDLTCYERVDLANASSNVLLYGSDDKTQKLQALEQIETYCGRTQWQKLLTDIPNIIMGPDIAVILNQTGSTLRFQFGVPSGTYNIILRCIMPSANSDSGYVRLDSLPDQMFTRGYGPTKYSTRQLNFLLFDRIQLEEGYHEIVFRFREPIGYIDLFVSRTDQTIPDLVMPAIDAINNPNKIYGDANYIATITPKVFYVPTTYAPLESTYPMATTMLPLPETTTMPPLPETTTMAPMTTTIAPPMTTTMAPPMTTTIAPMTTTIFPMTTKMVPTSWSYTGSACISTAQYKFGSSSMYIPGSDRVVMTSFPATTVLDGNWTIEFFVWIPANYPSSTGCVMSIGSTASTYIIFRLTPTQMMFYIGTTALGWQVANAKAYDYNVGAWNHVAVCFTASTYFMYLNGSLKYSAVNSINIGTNLVQFNFGSYLTNGNYTFSANGIYIDAMRISDIARYTSNTYVVPTTMYTTDQYTVFLKNFEANNGSTDFAANDLTTIMMTTTTMTPIITSPTTFNTVGATLSTSGAYTLYSFKNSGTFVPSANITANVLIVGGGGGGGSGYDVRDGGGGGGGAGGVGVGTVVFQAGIKYTITVGAGGSGALLNKAGGNGGDSSIVGGNISITVKGGGSGNTAGISGKSGGSAGSSTSDSSEVPAVIPLTKVGTGISLTSMGNVGGKSTGSNGSAGGGGAGGAGESASMTGDFTNFNGGAGGVGYLWSFTTKYYAGGGGGGSLWDANRKPSGGKGGSGVGGNGGIGTSNGNGNPGVANTGGGGGGGAGRLNSIGGAGGSGIVVIVVPI